MKKHRKPEQFIQQPGYPGGQEAIKKVVRENLRYPKEALKAKIEGTVKVDFDYDESGRVIKTSVKQGLGYGCDEEAQRVVKLLRFNKSHHRGKRVTFHTSINIHFRLPKASQRQTTYQFKPTAKTESSEQAKSVTYTYTIKRS